MKTKDKEVVVRFIKILTITRLMFRRNMLNEIYSSSLESKR
jgi:hypothetical protein